ncbi:MAG: hypothetical protein E6R13_00140 [Spirochaetes bacterium]|nr:MAG: hypothetical protein E6R13_00140 [Spirochaetota bacterium]
MSDQQIQELLEIQYLKGRLDELHKAFPTVTNLERSRKLDMRLSKYYSKLKAVSEQAYHLYQVERINQGHSKRKSQGALKELFNKIIPHIKDEELLSEIKRTISKYAE